MTENRSDTPTGLLRQEHELILRVADAVDSMFGPNGDQRQLDYDDVNLAISFFRLYADECHHGKEEDLLFPCLEAHGLPRDVGPVAVMLEEHEQGRFFVADMAANVDGARDDDSSSSQGLRAAALGFVELITSHILKENNILFEMADQMIVGSECQDLCAAYAVLSEHRFEGYSKSDLEEVAEGILARNTGV